MQPCRLHRTASWIFQLVAAVILGQTLFFKFSGAPESIFIFSTLGAEPWGRVASGCAELVAVLLLLRSRTAPLGALLSLVLLTGAIGAHLTRLGLAVRDDGGLLFTLAVAVFGSSLAVLLLHRQRLPWIGARLGPGPGACAVARPQAAPSSSPR